jgi:hypothetical protein
MAEWITKKKKPTEEWITKKKKPKGWITKKEKKEWITKKEKPQSWITKKKKPTEWIKKKEKSVDPSQRRQQRKQQQEQSVKQNLTKDYSYTGTPGAKATGKGVYIKYNTNLKKGGRAGYRGGGRTRLLEELGRVEAEPSNRNRRAEISRVHGELNRGYKSGGAVLKGKKVGIQIK